MLWAALAVAFAASAGMAYLSHHPSVYPVFVREVSKLLLWLNDANTDSFFIVPNAYIWVLVLMGATLLLSMRLSVLLTTELTNRYFPKYLRYRCSTELGKAAKKYQKEWERENANPAKNRLGISLSFFGLMCVLIGLASKETTIMVTAFGCFIVIGIGAYWLERPETQRKREDIRKRFDPEKLIIQQRKTFWRGALRAWIIFPPIIMFLSYIIPFFIFDSDGVRAYSHCVYKLIPWSKIESFEITVRGTPSYKTSSKESETVPEKPFLDMALDLNQDKIDINGLGMIEVDPSLLNRLVSLFQKHNVQITCSSDPKGIELLLNDLKSPDTSERIDYQEMLELILRTCEFQVELNAGS